LKLTLITTVAQENVAFSVDVSVDYFISADFAVFMLSIDAIGESHYLVLRHLVLADIYDSVKRKQKL